MPTVGQTAIFPRRFKLDRSMFYAVLFANEPDFSFEGDLRFGVQRRDRHRVQRADVPLAVQTPQVQVVNRSHLRQGHDLVFQPFHIDFGRGVLQ